MNLHSVKTLILLLAALSVVLACALPALPLTVAANPTSNPASIQTIVVATAGAAQTQTALALPPSTSTLPATLPPTSTPTDTATATATIIFIIPTKTYTPTPTSPPTATGQPSSQLPGASCQLVDQTPSNDTVYGSRERFNVKWTIKNTGNDTWLASNIDFSHSGGRDMHDTDILDLPNNVRAGGQVTLSVDMRAPGEAGSYTSTWRLGSPKGELCQVSVRIVVR